ncbi:hypothetical protein LEP1GSC041_0783 [Leptospira noguchii str. 2006001870]|nr:hypothetical protein LEP1GSC041_0783 [Leptospira noguchii str. 2006001870]
MNNFLRMNLRLWKRFLPILIKLSILIFITKQNIRRLRYLTCKDRCGEIEQNAFSN